MEAVAQVVAAYLAWLFTDRLSLEWIARMAVAGACFWHPIHEQRIGYGFRLYFNSAVTGKNPISFPGPLGPRMNALQAVALAILWPAVALFGPWWTILAAFSFYTWDRAFTHGVKEIPGGWSALLAGLLLAPAFVLTFPDDPERWAGIVALASIAAGALILAAPWWMAYRKVRVR